METIYIFHKQGANSHYIALEYLLKKQQKQIKFREFSVVTLIAISIKTLDFKLFRKQFINIAFLISLLFSRDKKIVFGIAPFDYKILGLLYLLKNHRIYYHTSWACWDKSFHPKKKKNSKAVFERWRNFLEKEVEHIFCVTQKSKEELLENYQIPAEKISVVYHALHPVFSTEAIVRKKPNSFIYYGRIVTQKGIKELLEYFKDHPGKTITFIGDGNQKHLIEKYMNDYPNIIFKDKMENITSLKNILASHEYLILNAKWEELFSLVIIESMSQGVIPISSALTGPKEIITNGENGLLFKEGELRLALDRLHHDMLNKRQIIKNAKLSSRRYSRQQIAQKWQPILN